MRRQGGNEQPWGKRWWSRLERPLGVPVALGSAVVLSVDLMRAASPEMEQDAT